MTEIVDASLERRKQMNAMFEAVLREAPEEAEKIIKVIGEIYVSRKIPRFWDFIAGLAGADRGYGGTWYYNVLEMIEKNKERKK